MLVGAGAKLPALPYYKELPAYTDSEMHSLMSKLAEIANEQVLLPICFALTKSNYTHTCAQARKEQEELERREQEAQREEEERAAAAAASRKKRASPDSPPMAAPTTTPFTIGSTSPSQNRGSPHFSRKSKPWRQVFIPSSPTAKASENNQSPVKFSLPATEDAAPKPSTSPQPHSSEPQFVSAPNIPLSAFGASTISSNTPLSSFGGSTISPNVPPVISQILSQLPPKPQVPTCTCNTNYLILSSLASLIRITPAASSETSMSIGSAEMAAAVIAIIQLYKQGYIDQNLKGKLKTLALTKDRRLYAAFKAYMFDKDTEEFAETVKLLCCNSL